MIVFKAGFRGSANENDAMTTSISNSMALARWRFGPEPRESWIFFHPFGWASVFLLFFVVGNRDKPAPCSISTLSRPQRLSTTRFVEQDQGRRRLLPDRRGTLGSVRFWLSVARRGGSRARLFFFEARRRSKRVTCFFSDECQCQTPGSDIDPGSRSFQSVALENSRRYPAPGF